MQVYESSAERQQMTSLKGCADKYFVEIVRNETFDDRSSYGSGFI